MTAVESILMVAFVLPSLLAVSWCREQLRWVEPGTRFSFGIAAFFGSIAVFYVVMKMLPEPAEIEGDLFLMSLLVAGASIAASGMVLSLALTCSAAWQAFKRWKFQRSNFS
ncbi:hypothetical protein [Sphingomonas sp.]|jgi:hypothetical protein|uniref:hypothetical protein n=1 Tax=Sphingomonas sp. TaxID=28214 RepID=UPI002E0DBE5F|nr:hypothetical protein [Sphingomonas sp.]